MNDWDDLSGTQSNSADTGSPSSPASAGSSNVTPLAAVAANNSNKTMYLAMGGLMLFVMGVFGYTKYMEFQGVQNDERMQQQQAFQKSKAEAEQQKRKSEEKATPPVAAATTAAAAPVAEQVPAPASQPQGDDLAMLAQLKNRSNTNPATPAPVAVPAVVATAPVSAALPGPATQSAPAIPMAAPTQDGQKRDQYVSLLEGRVNDLGLAKLRLEAELCKYEPGRGFCARSNKGVAAPEVLREPVRPASRSVQSTSETSGRVMLFDTTKAGNAIAVDLPRTVSNSNTAMPANSQPRSQAAEVAPKTLSLQGLTILRDRVLYRDRDGLTHEVELGGNMENLGRLERIDFERKSFQAGGRTYN